MKETAGRRFWAKVDKSRGADSCWTWTACVFNSGYGKFYRDRDCRTAYAHRFSYELHVGTIPDGMFVCHRCDNPKCVNPAHLFVGTNADNVADMVAKGRQSGHPGESNGRAKLTEHSVRAIRELYGTGPTKAALAKLFGVSESQIRRVISRERWVSIV